MADPGLLTSLVVCPSSLASVPDISLADRALMVASTLEQILVSALPRPLHSPPSLPGRPILLSQLNNSLLGGGAHPEAAIVHLAQEVTLRLTMPCHGAQYSLPASLPSLTSDHSWMSTENTMKQSPGNSGPLKPKTLPTSTGVLTFLEIDIYLTLRLTPPLSPYLCALHSLEISRVPEGLLHAMHYFQLRNSQAQKKEWLNL